MTSPRQRSFEVRVPASTANLGAGFDCLGLALELYLTARATAQIRPGSRTLARTRGVGSASLPRSPEQNLIFRAMRLTAERENIELPPVRLAVKNEIPMAGGLGSSAAAAVAGVALGYAVAGRPLSRENALRYATEIEGHSDNAAAALHGGLVVTYTGGDASDVGALKIPWPKMIRVIAVTPALELATKKSRAVLPASVPRSDAVHNLQRSALFVAAITTRRYELIWEAMRDRLHHSYREHLVPGFEDVLAMPQMPGLLGLALSGAGPSAIALVTAGFDEIGKAIAAHFERAGLAATIRFLEVAQEGVSSLENRPRRR
jgi:homoserine kinase